MRHNIYYSVHECEKRVLEQWYKWHVLKHVRTSLNLQLMFNSLIGFFSNATKCSFHILCYKSHKRAIIPWMDLFCKIGKLSNLIYDCLSKMALVGSRLGSSNLTITIRLQLLYFFYYFGSLMKLKFFQRNSILPNLIEVRRENRNRNLLLKKINYQNTLNSQTTTS